MKHEEIVKKIHDQVCDACTVHEACNTACRYVTGYTQKLKKEKLEKETCGTCASYLTGRAEDEFGGCDEAPIEHMPGMRASTTVDTPACDDWNERTCGNCEHDVIDDGILELYCDQCIRSASSFEGHRVDNWEQKQRWKTGQPRKYVGKGSYKKYKEDLEHHAKPGQNINQKVKNLENFVHQITRKKGLEILHCNSCGTMVLEDVKKCHGCGKQWKIPGSFRDFMKENFKNVSIVGIVVFFWVSVFGFMILYTFNILWYWSVVSGIAGYLILITMLIILLGLWFDDPVLEKVSVSIKKYRSVIEKAARKKERKELEAKKKARDAERAKKRYEAL